MAVPDDLRAGESRPRPTCLATGSGTCRLGLPLEDCETLRDRVVWLVRVRWYVVVAALVGSAAGALLLPEAAEWLGLAAIAGALGAFNLLWHFRAAHGARTLCGGVLPFSSYQILTDFVLLAGAVHLTGGISGPLTPLFVLHGVFSAVLLPKWHTAGTLAAAAAAMLGSVFLAHVVGWLPAWRLGRPGVSAAWLPEVAGLAFLLLATIGASAIGLHLAQQLRVRHTRIATLARELSERNTALRQVDEQRVRLLGVASHDLRSPLAAIESRLDVLLQGYAGSLTDAQREQVEKVRNRLRELRTFVNDLLDVTALESRAVQAVPTERVDVVRQVREAAAELAPLAEASAVEIRVQAPETAAWIRAPRGRLALVWANLISNAVKYGGGAAVVAVAVDDGRVRVTVSDRGPGMSAEDLAGLFSDFFRTRSARESGIPGTGLGLAIAKRVVDGLGGDIAVESEPGRGTSFTVTLPIETEP